MIEALNIFFDRQPTNVRVIWCISLIGKAKVVPALDSTRFSSIQNLLYWDGRYMWLCLCRGMPCEEIPLRLIRIIWSLPNNAII